LGKPHDGPDSADNVLCLCPNDHVLFDRGGLLLSDALEILDGATGKVLGQLQMKAGHELDIAHVAYHRETHEGIAL
jgi:putative restriction endonuclease